MTKNITLTHEQANFLACYILITTNHRKEAADTWKKLAEEKNDDGTPKYKNAAGNASWWEESEERLTEIRKIIDDADLKD